MQERIKYLGDFFIKDNIRNRNRSSKYFREIHKFLKQYLIQYYPSQDPGLVMSWSYEYAVENLFYGFVNGEPSCVDGEEIILVPQIRVYSWPDIQFMLNLEEILK